MGGHFAYAWKSLSILWFLLSFNSYVITTNWLMTRLDRPCSLMVKESSQGAGGLGSVSDHVTQKVALSTLVLMVWVGTSLLTRGVVFQWASTIKTGRRSD